MLPNGIDRRRKNRRRRTLRSLDQSSNLLDVHYAGNDETTTGSLRAHCHLIGLLPVNTASPYFSYENALAIQLAVKHLNEGNGGLVPAISGLNETCPLSFSASITDTHWNKRMAFQAVDQLTESTNTGGAYYRPCGFVGAVGSAISKSTAMITGLRGIPQVSQASTSSDLDDKSDYPLFARTVPDDGFMAEALIRFFYENLNVRHLFVIVESDPFPKSVLKSLRDAILRLGWSPGFNSTLAGGNYDINGDANNSTSSDPKSNIMYMEERIIETIANTPEGSYDIGLLYEALEALKASEFRFVLVLTRGGDDSLRVMRVAQEEGLAGKGTHHFWFYESMNLSTRRYEPDSAIAQALDGIGYIYQTSIKEGTVYKQFVEDSRQLKRELYLAGPGSNETAAAAAAAAPPAASDWLYGTYKNITGPLLNESDWLENDYLFEKPLYAYDATVLLGLSACREVASVLAKDSPGSNEDYPSSEPLVLTGTDFYERIRRTNFTGVTGTVLLDPETGTRDGHSVQYAIDNWLAFEDRGNDNGNGNYTVGFKPTNTYVYRPGGGKEWDNVNRHILSGGKPLASLGPHPDLPPMNIVYSNVNPLIPWTAIAVLAIILLTTTWFVIWTCRHWKSRVVQASQPHFLLLTCFGIAITSLSIIPLSREHVAGRINENIWFDRGCTSTWWFAFIGFGITFSTLFAKTKRVNQIMSNSLSCKRIKLSMRETIYPVAIIFCFNVVMLSLMSIFAPLTYEITVTKFDRFSRPSEKYGNCQYKDSLWYLLPIGIVNVGLVGLALFQAWRARYLTTEFAESKYIANALLIILLVILFAIPVLVITQNDPNIDTFINVALAVVFTVNPLCFIFIPKIIFHAKSKIPAHKRASVKMSALLGRVSNPRLHTERTFATRRSTAPNRVSQIDSTNPLDYSGNSHRNNDAVRDDSSGETEVGEKVLTFKPQNVLFSEIQILEIENAALQSELEELHMRLLGIEGNDAGGADGIDRDNVDTSESGIRSDATYEFRSHAPTSNDDGSNHDDDQDPEANSNFLSDSLTAEDDEPDQSSDSVPKESTSQRHGGKHRRTSFLRFSLGSR